MTLTAARGVTVVAFLRLESVRPEMLLLAELEDTYVRSLQYDRWRNTGNTSFLPAHRAETPAITRFKTGETVFRARCAQVV